ncbi:CRISPR-associated endonuclease Cas2, partial [Desulfovibrio sp.]|uniref:CRISPR-associated endonuclease Cas2 n=1 Tax=Desulfovibrio sp. TaxID=885 RepID=UPI00257AC6EF
MPAEEVRYMRLLVFFDLPVKTKDDQREANHFRNFLLRDGYDRVQLSVYARVCRGPENVETHIRRLQKNLPPHGCVRL